MAASVIRLTHDDPDALLSVSQAADDARRHQLGLTSLPPLPHALGRPHAFGVGLFDELTLVSAAVAMPARGDDGRSEHNVPGLAHISSVMTDPKRWGEGLAGRSVRAVMMHATRRGFARASLWTHRSSLGARRLYEREGFVLSGREKLDDHGEAIVNYLRELPRLEVKSRPAARMVCLDDRGRVLLMHWRDPVDGHQLWEPPGGGVKAGESARDAVVREWREETGLASPKFDEATTTVSRDTIWQGGRWVSDEHFFLGRWGVASEVQPADFTPAETASYLGHAWVDPREADNLEDPVEPDLLPVLSRLLAP